MKWHAGTDGNTENETAVTVPSVSLGLAGVLLAVIMGAVVFLTLQGPKETMALSESFREWFRKIGYKGNANQFRSDVQLIEYFIVGIAAVLF